MALPPALNNLYMEAVKAGADQENLNSIIFDRIIFDRAPMEVRAERMRQLIPKAMEAPKHRTLADLAKAGTKRTGSDLSAQEVKRVKRDTQISTGARAKVQANRTNSNPYTKSVSDMYIKLKSLDHDLATSAKMKQLMVRPTEEGFKILSEHVVHLQRKKDERAEKNRAAAAATAARRVQMDKERRERQKVEKAAEEAAKVAAVKKKEEDKAARKAAAAEKKRLMMEAREARAAAAAEKAAAKEKEWMDKMKQKWEKEYDSYGSRATIPKESPIADIIGMMHQIKKEEIMSLIEALGRDLSEEIMETLERATIKHIMEVHHCRKRWSKDHSSATTYMIKKFKIK